MGFYNKGKHSPGIADGTPRFIQDQYMDKLQGLQQFIAHHTR